ncbi:MAG: hypothetical protein Greene041662_793 [Candidatus Peregrinibacteria bacterium Greene0416_62]|nr:MAG: hypothetical protein Greene041662_793 [Candidatus Peregrinibacteria bacterium Greene0416_62]TSC98006.1 MAG: hypothetical protein Greene101449_1028 [Candidatus Peregrinibacteria bacterium Greene1014_49]
MLRNIGIMIIVFIVVYMIGFLSAKNRKQMIEWLWVTLMSLGIGLLFAWANGTNVLSQL